MKKTLFAIAALLGGIQFANAQTEKGTQNLGLSLAYTNSNSTSRSAAANGASMQKFDSKGFTISPSYGYFICNGTELGGSLVVNSSTQNQTNEFVPLPGSGTTTVNSKNNSNLYGALVYLRKYVLYKDKIGFRFGPFASYNLGKNSTTDYTGNEIKNDVTQYSIGANLDLIYYPSSKLGLALNILGANYAHFKYKDGNTTPQEGSSFLFSGTNNNVAVSVFYVIGRK